MLHGSAGGSFREASSESSEKIPVHGQSWLAKERMASGMSENKQDAIRENSKGISVTGAWLASAPLWPSLWT